MVCRSVFQTYSSHQLKGEMRLTVSRAALIAEDGSLLVFSLDPSEGVRYVAPHD